MGEGKSFRVGGFKGMGERKSFLWWMVGMGGGKNVVVMVDGGEGMGKKVALGRVGGKGMVERKSFG